MELIKKLKQAEAQSKELIEEAKVEAGRLAQEARSARASATHQAEHHRTQAIDEAVAAARGEAAAEVARMNAEAGKGRQELREQTKGRLDGAVRRVMDYLKE